MPYKYLEDIAVADVCFEASGKTIEEMFESSGLATTNVMIKTLKKISQKEKRKISVEADTIENLLFKFLEEIIFLKDAKQLVFSKYKVKISTGSSRRQTKSEISSASPFNGGKIYKLECEAAGEKLNMKKHDWLVDIKAVTWHLFEVRKEKNVWRARVILDI